MTIYKTVHTIISEECKAKAHYLIITGDFNLPNINWDNYSSPHLEPHKEHVFLNTVRDNFLAQHVSTPTRNILNQTPHILDLVLTKNEDIISDLDLLPPLGSRDHNLIFMKTTINSDKKEIAEKYVIEKRISQKCLKS